MAALTVTAASVARVSGGVCTDFVAGEAITAGQAVYLKTSNNKWMMAQADGTAEEAGGSTRTGIALSTGVLNQPIAVQESGIITIGATVVVAKVYCIGETYGAINPIADITTSADYLTILAYGATASTLNLGPKYITGVQIP